MEFRIPDEVEAFRREVSEFVSQEWREEFNRGTYAEHVEHEERFRRKLGEKGWLGVSWPKEYGGQGRSLLEQYVFVQEMTYHGAPMFNHGPGIVQTSATPGRSGATTSLSG